MSNIQIAIYNHLTQENIVRDLTEEELLQLEAENAATEQVKIEAETAREALKAKN